jgi:hypothetical protein
VTASNSPSSQFTTARLGSAAAKTLGVTGNDSRTQNWSFLPISNAFEAARLMALYRYAVDSDEIALKANYPKLYKSVTSQRNVCLTDINGRPVNVQTAAPTVDKSTQLPTTPRLISGFTRCLNTYGQPSGNGSMTQGTDSISNMIPDPYYLQGPLCVLCKHGRRLVANPRLSGRWLHWKALIGASGRRPDTWVPGDIPLGIYGHYELFVDYTQALKASQFIVFALAASTQTDSSGPGGGSSSSQGGVKQAVQSLLSGAQCQADSNGFITCF